MFELPSPVRQTLGEEATEEKQRTRVSVFTLFLVVAVILLALPQVKELYYGRPIYYIADHGPGVMEPGKVPDGMALKFAKGWIEIRHTYTPETYKTKMAQLGLWLHPKIRLAFKKQIEEELRDVHKWQQSSQAVIGEDGLRVVRRAGPLIYVELVGIRSVFLGGRVREENMRTDMALMPYFPEGYDGRLVVMQEQTRFNDAK